MTDWTFHNGKTKPAGQWEREGKAEWRDLVRIELSRRQALEIIDRIALQLQSVDEVYLELVGELVKDDE